MASTKSPQLSVVYDFLQITRTLNRDELSALMHDSFEFTQLPNSYAKAVGAEGLKGKTEYLNMVVGVFQKLFKNFKYIVHEVNERPGVLWLHATSDAVLKNDKAYKGEYIFMFNFTSGEGSPKITSFAEFVDSDEALKANIKSSDTSDA